MTINPTWTVSDWDPTSREQESSIRSLEEANGYALGNCSPAYFNWQYRANPSGTAVLALATLDQEDGKVIGQYVALPWTLGIRGEKVLAALSVNTLIDKNFRGAGALFPLARQCFLECAQRGMEYVIGYPNPSLHAVAIRFLKFRSIGETPLLIRLLKPFAALRKRLKPGCRLRLPEFLSALDRFAPIRKDAHSDSVTVVSHFDPSFDELNECLMQRYPVVVSRHAEFLEWRYKRSPFDYTVFAARDADRLCGYLVCRIMDYAGMKCGMIVDFVLRGDDSSAETGKALIGRAAAEMLASDCDIMGALSQSQSDEYKSLRRNFFFDCPLGLKPQPIAFVAQETGASRQRGVDVFAAGNWFYAMGDYDAV